MREYINSKWADFVHDHSIETAHCACSHRRRVDHRKLVGNTLLCVETDERAHQGYDMDDEEARYHDIMMAWGGKLLFLRINPDNIISNVWGSKGDQVPRVSGACSCFRI